MTNKELRKLSRVELLELLIEQGRENQTLQEQLAQTQAELESRQIRIADCGSIAEAALKLNGVFEAAQQAVDQYRMNCEKECAAKIEEAERKAAEILNEAKQKKGGGKK